MNYIYGLFCPIALTIRYVGKSNKPDVRLKHHLSTCHRTSHYAGRWLASLKRKSLRPDLIILAEIEEGGDWESVERNYIASGAELGWKLTNTTPGGEGGGYVRPEDKAEWIEKVRSALNTDEIRNKISEGVKRAYKDPIVREKAAARMRRQWDNPDYRSRVSRLISEAMSSPHNKQKTADRGKRLMSKPGAREEVSRKLSLYYATEEGRANKLKVANRPENVEACRKGQIRNWQDPEYRKSQMAAKTSPEAIRLQKEKARNQWADPEIRAKMLAAMKGARERKKQAI